MKDFNDKANKFVSGLSSVSSGLKGLGIEIPQEMENVIGVINNIMGVIQGVQSVISVFQVSAITANTTALTMLTSAMIAKSFLPFGLANGGVVRAAGGWVGGRTFSGDMIPARLNAGELVLNQAQAGVIASALQDRDFSGGMGGQPYVDGERIILGVENTYKRKGKGEIVTTSMLRRMGIM